MPMKKSVLIVLSEWGHWGEEPISSQDSCLTGKKMVEVEKGFTRCGW
jgi:hypothetical protein